MTRALSIIAVCSACAAVCVGEIRQTPPAPPPTPKVAKVAHKSSAVERGAGAAALIAKAAPVVVIVPATKTLKWDWKEDPSNLSSNVVFIVRCATNIALPKAAWLSVGVTNGMTWPFTIDLRKPCGFYSVQVSNTLTGMVSQ